MNTSYATSRGLLLPTFVAFLFGLSTLAFPYVALGAFVSTQGLILPDSPATCTIPVGGSSCSHGFTTEDDSVASPPDYIVAGLWAQAFSSTTPLQQGPLTQCDGSCVLDGFTPHIDKAALFDTISNYSGGPTSLRQIATSKVVVASCATGSSWNGSVCVSDSSSCSAYWGAVSSSPNYCVVPVGQSSCTMNFTTDGGESTYPGNWNMGLVYLFIYSSTTSGPQSQTVCPQDCSVGGITPDSVRATLKQEYTVTGSFTPQYVCLATEDIAPRCATGSLWNGSSCAPMPDLTAGTISPTTATAGTAKTFSATITNGGTASTGKSFYNFMQVENGAGTITDLGAVSMSTLAAGANNTTSKSYTFASAGTYSIRACADKSSSGNTGTITESDETNNCGAWTTITVSTATVIPTVSLTVSPSSVASGSRPTLTWSSTNATSCTAPSGNWSNSGTLSGSGLTDPITQNTTFTFQCTGPGGTSPLASATVTVTNSAPTVSLTVSPSSVASGSRPTLTWSSTNATSCTAPSGNWSNSGTLSGSGLTDPITQNTTFTFQCTGPGGTSPLASATVTVTGLVNGVCASTHYSCTAGTSANAQNQLTSYTWSCVGSAGGTTASCTELKASALTATLSASPSTINSGQSSTLTWSSTNANKCVSAGGFSTGNATSGTASTGALSNTASYQITCTNLLGSSAIANTTVTVINPNETISATQPLIHAGDSTSIVWSSTDTTSCVVSGPGLYSTSLTGSQSVTPTTQSTYTITCDSLAPQSITVNVTPRFQEF